MALHVTLVNNYDHNTYEQNATHHTQMEVI